VSNGRPLEQRVIDGRSRNVRAGAIHTLRSLESWMSAEDKVAAARRRVGEAEASMLLALASARAVLSEVEEENRELRREALKRETQFYTEAEFAALLKVSESTIARARKSGQLQPLRVGVQIRYSSLNVEQAEQIFGAKQQRSRPHMKRVS
jgi:Helix-turn-helix domain